MIDRTKLITDVQKSLKRSPITALIGPRQCGKTTIARQIGGMQAGQYFDLEDPEDEQQLREPKLNLSRLQGLIIIDEIQHRPDLLPVLRVLADRKPQRSRFLLLGSTSPALVKGSSESLAGRIEYIEMSGFSLQETGPERLDVLWQRGGFPVSFLAETEEDSRAWRENFIRTFLERDIPQLGLQLPAPTLRRFWTMVAHYHAQMWNASAIGRSLAVSHHTVNKYLDILCGAFVIRRLEPWFENVSKRLVKSPKIYIRDSGILHALLRLPDREAVLSHPKLGASWEGFALEQVLAVCGNIDAYFYGTQKGAELDLFLLRKGKRWGVEFKFGDAPAMTKSLYVALEDLSLERACIVYPGTQRYAVHDKVDCVPLEAFHEWAVDAGMVK